MSILGQPFSRSSRARNRASDPRSERGDTLVEVLLALVVLALASVALLIAFSTSIAASAEHRKLATDDTVLATASQEVLSLIENEPSLFTDACTTPISSYPMYSASVGFTLPAPYDTSAYDVQYLTLNANLNQYPVLWWNPSLGTFTSTCEADQPQLITISLVGTTYTNSFVVDYPVGAASNSSVGPTSSETLAFLNVPVGGYAGSPFTTQPIVAIESNGTPVTTDLSDVNLSISSTSPSTGVLAGCQGNEVLGVVTFSGCTIGSGGTYILEATDITTNGTITALSQSFTVQTAGYYLSFIQQPTAGASGSVFATDPEVAVCGTNVSPCSASSADTAWTGTISMTSSGGEFTNCPQATTATSVTVQVVSGVAAMPSSCDFEGGYFYNPNSSPQVTETHYILTATSNPSAGSFTAVPATSNAFWVSDFGPATQLAFSVQPTGVASSSASTSFAQQPVVEVEDAFGNVVTSATEANTPILISMFEGSSYPGTTESLTCSTPSSSEGTYTYSGCHGSAYNDNLHLYVYTSSGSLTPATSAAFDITQAPTKLVFATSPTAAASASTFVQQPVLEYEDSSNNLVTAVTSPVSFSVSPSTGSISSCTNLVPSGGVVDVQNCIFVGLINTPYTLTATGDSLTSLPSAAFEVTGPGPASQLVFTTEPVAGNSQAALTTQPIIKVEDSAGNVVTSSTATVVLTSSGNGIISNCTGMTASAGVVTASNCTFAGNVQSDYFLTATSGTLTGQSTEISPSGPGPLSQILLSDCSASVNVTQGCQLTATLADEFGNVETPDDASVVTFSGSPTGVASGFTSDTVSNGVATDTITTVTPGVVTLEAQADGFTSSPLTLTVNALVPTINFTYATGGSPGAQSVTATYGTTFNTVATTSSTGALSYQVTSGSNVCSLTGTTVSFASAGSCTVTAMVPANGDYSAASATLTITVAPISASTTTSLTTPTITYGSESSANFTGTVTGVNGDGYPEGTVSVYYNYSGTKVLICSETLPAGSGYTANYSCAESRNTALAAGSYSSVVAVFTPGTTSSSNVDYAYSTSSSTATTFTVGTESESSSISLTTPTITYGSESSANFTGTVTGVNGDGYPEGTVSVYYNYSGTKVLICSETLPAGSGYTASYSCAESSNTALAAGSYSSVVAVFTPGTTSSSNVDYAYSTSSSTATTFTVGAETPTVTFTNGTGGSPPSQTATMSYGSTLNAVATTNSTGTIAYQVSTTNNTAGCSLSGTTVSVTSVGSCTVTASVPANGNFAAGSSTLTITVGTETPTVTFTNATGGSPPAQTATLSYTSGSTLNAVATTNSTGTISYQLTSSGSSTCTLSGTTVEVTSNRSTGTCTVTASVSANGNFAAGSSTLTITVERIG